MIIYNPAFDLYHGIFRMAHIVQRMADGERFEIDKVRIWDFFLLYPDKVHTISIKRSESDLRQYRSTYLRKTNNPYDYNGDDRRLFEWIKPFQLSALSCLASCGILRRDDYLAGSVVVADRKALDAFVREAGTISDREHNVLSFLSLLSRNLPLTGVDGLKQRTKLLEYRYDAE